MAGIGAFRDFMRTRLNIEPYSSLKSTKVGFIFIGPNSSVEQKILQLSITGHKLSSELSLRLGFKSEFRKLRPECTEADCKQND